MMRPGVTFGGDPTGQPPGCRNDAHSGVPAVPAYSGLVLIIAGSLTVDPADRAAFLAANAEVVGQARQAPGCLDFVQAADPLDPSRINIFERWDNEGQLMAFRGVGQPASDSPPILSANVKRYIISAVEDP